jgi:hypothetical protein
VAQWLGQYSGRTHSSKVKDLEESLRKAVTAFHGSRSEKEQSNKLASARRLAKRLLAARRRQISAQRGFVEKSSHGKNIEGILSEFGITQNP